MHPPFEHGEHSPALFLDRDGVIIENRAEYIRSWEDVHFLPGALQALSRARSAPFRIVIVTNQSAVGRGLVDPLVADDINARLVAAIRAAGGRVDGLYMCPHAPEQDCDCRKPKPGLLLQAATDLNLDLGASALIGDALTDILAARAAGVGEVELVLTGRGREQVESAEADSLQPFRVYPDLAHALRARLDH